MGNIPYGFDLFSDVDEERIVELVWVRQGHHRPSQLALDLLLLIVVHAQRVETAYDALILQELIDELLGGLHQLLLVHLLVACVLQVKALEV